MQLNKNLRITFFEMAGMEIEQTDNSSQNINSKNRAKRPNEEASGSNPKKQAMKPNSTKTIMIEVSS